MSFEPQNKLERSLVQASSDAAFRPQFYKDFVEADLFIIEEGWLPESRGKKVLKEGQTLKIRHIEWNSKNCIPVFSSILRMQSVLTEGAAYVCLNSIDLMTITRGAELVLNPGSDFGKEFTVDEIASLIDGTIWEPSETFVSKKETRVLLGQPARYPTDLAHALSRYFKTMKNVKRAYLAHYSNPEGNDKPHTLIAIEYTGNWNDIMAGAGIVARGIEVPDPPIDFLAMKGREGIEDYFRHDCKPFYVRKILGIF